MKKILILIFLFAYAVLSAQNQQYYSYNNTPLSLVLKDVQDKNSIEFSFATKEVEGKFITLKEGSYSLQEIIQELSIQANLEFKKINNTQYVIIAKVITGKYCGYVLDAESQHPINGAIITLHSGEDILTDTYGFYECNAAEVEVIIKAFGYKEQSVNLSSDCPKVLLQVQTLGEVVISSYITSGIDRNKDGSIGVDTDRLGILPGLVSPDIAQSIQLIPGITSLDESATGIQIRGGSPDQNLILYDNIKLYNTGYFYGMFSLFNPFSTQKATIFKSGTSASYGDRISGIIDISSGEDIPEKTQGGFEVDGISVNGYVKTPLSNKVSVYAFARRSYSDVLKTPTYNSYEDKIFTNFGVVKDINDNVLVLETDDDFTPETSNNDFSFTDLSTKLIYKPNTKNTIGISGLYTRNRLDFDFTGGDELVVDSLQTQNKGLSFEWKHVANEKQQEKFTAYYSEYNSFYQNNEIKDETGDGIRDLAEINIRKNDVVDVGLNFTSITQIKDSQKLALGYQLSYTDLDILLSKENPVDAELEQSIQDNSNLKNAAFGEYTFNFKNKSLVSGGVRLVHYNALDKFLIEPRINFEYQINKQLRFKTAIERRNQPISQLVEFNHTELRLENELWRLSDKDQFPLLSSNQISGGLLYHYNKLSIDLDAYYKELEGLTTFTNGFSNPLEDLEQGKSTIKGVDVLLKYKLSNYKVWAGYTFNDIIFKFPNLQDTAESFPGNNDITHHFRISNTLQLKNWQFSLGWQYRTGKPITPVNSYVINIDADGEPAGVVNFGSINSGRLPDFHRLDASIIHDLKVKTKAKELKGQLGVSFLNIYNRVKPLDLIYKAERKPLDDGGIAIPGTAGATPEELEVILEQVIQRFSLGFTPNVVLRLFF